MQLQERKDKPLGLPVLTFQGRMPRGACQWKPVWQLAADLAGRSPDELVAAESGPPYANHQAGAQPAVGLQAAPKDCAQTGLTVVKLRSGAGRRQICMAAQQSLGSPVWLQQVNFLPVSGVCQG